jgi:hypothetical protein
MEGIELIGDVVAICMCAVTVLLLIKQQLKFNSKSSEKKPLESLRNFSRELTRLVGEPPEVPRPSMGYGSLESLRSQSADPEKDVEQTGYAGSGSNLEACQNQDEEAIGARVSNDPYDHVRRLAEMGLDKEEIFKRVDMPKGEIELILKLQTLRPSG